MKIGFFLEDGTCTEGFAEVAPARAQVPIRVMRLLVEAGHEVELVTSRCRPGRERLPSLPRIRVREIECGQARREPAPGVGPARGLGPMAGLGWTLALSTLLRRERYDVLQLWGGARTARVGALARALGFRGRIALGVDDAPGTGVGWPVLGPCLRALNTVFTATHHVRSHYLARGLRARILRPGALRCMGSMPPPGRSRRVLFWRELSNANGADVCFEVFRLLAPLYPDVSFDLALRPHRAEVPGVRALAAAHPNVHVWRFPYPEGTTLERLLADSACVLLPLREVTAHPQTALLESLAAGRPVVTTELGSNAELVLPGHNGLLVPPGDVLATTRAVDRVLSDPALAAQLGRNAATSVASGWSWDGYVDRLVSLWRGLESPPATRP